MKDFSAAYYRDVVLMQEMLSFTCATAVMLTSSSKTVCQHIVQTIELLQRETPQFIGPSL